jgi:hypothetical protein
MAVIVRVTILKVAEMQLGMPIHVLASKAYKPL